MSLGWASVSLEMAVAQMLKLHLSYMKVSVAVAAMADNHILLSFKYGWLVFQTIWR